MIGLIVARSKNNVIGKDGKIPWKILILKILILEFV